VLMPNRFFFNSLFSWTPSAHQAAYQNRLTFSESPILTLD
jgi:hypothetical protein